MRHLIRLDPGEKHPRKQVGGEGLAGFPLYEKIELRTLPKGLILNAGSALVELSNRYEARAGDAMQRFSNWRAERRQTPSVAFMQLLEQQDIAYITRAPREITQPIVESQLLDQVIAPPIAGE